MRSIEGQHDLFGLTAEEQCASYKCRRKRFTIFKVWFSNPEINWLGWDVTWPKAPQKFHSKPNVFSPASSQETQPIPVITYLMLSNPLWVVISLILFALGFPAHLGSCVSTSQAGHSHQLPRIRALQTDWNFISHIFASHLDSLHMNNPPILPGGLQTQQIYIAKGSSQVPDTESMLCMKINLKLLQGIFSRVINKETVCFHLQRVCVSPPFLLSFPIPSIFKLFISSPLSYIIHCTGKLFHANALW